MRVCPICGEEYDGYPVLSRKDNKLGILCQMAICPECGKREAMEDYFGNTRKKEDTVELTVLDVDEDGECQRLIVETVCFCQSMAESDEEVREVMNQVADALHAVSDMPVYSLGAIAAILDWSLEHKYDVENVLLTMAENLKTLSVLDFVHWEGKRNKPDK